MNIVYAGAPLQSPEQAAQRQCIPQMIMQMHIRYADGEEMTVISDRNSGWFTSSCGPIVSNSLYDGETYDARLEQTGWDLPGYLMNQNQSRDWQLPMVMEAPGEKLVSQTNEPIKVIGEIKPLSVSNPALGIYVYDMGQNFAGWVKLKVQGPRGTTIKLKFVEIVHDDGTINAENLRTIRPEDTYILKGEGTETYEPRFTYHGFRYVQVEGYPGVPELDSLTGRIVRSSVEPIGSFHCSHDLINKLHQNIVWTEANNLHSVPTDCPQRDERLGWLNDMTVRGRRSCL